MCGLAKLRRQPCCLQRIHALIQVHVERASLPARGRRGLALKDTHCKSMQSEEHARGDETTKASANNGDCEWG